MGWIDVDWIAAYAERKGWVDVYLVCARDEAHVFVRL